LLEERILTIYTDGSCYSSPRVGGVGIRFIEIDSAGAEHVTDVSLPGYEGATNNMMEVQAPILALREAKRLGLSTGKDKVVICTDSQYVVENYKRAMFEWQGNRWHSRSGRPVENADLWKNLTREMKSYSPCRVEFQWVKGHAGDPHNRAVDKQAKASARRPLQQPLKQVSVRRKRTEKSVQIGSVQMEGQTMRIRGITCEHLPQRVWKLKYEVISEDSPYFGNVDIIFSDCFMADGHCYEVTVNDDTRNPRVVELHRELPA
jgi:ribonuclease HI